MRIIAISDSLKSQPWFQRQLKSKKRAELLDHLRELRQILTREWVAMDMMHANYIFRSITIDTEKYKQHADVAEKAQDNFDQKLIIYEANYLHLDAEAHRYVNDKSCNYNPATND